jgi:WD40 repeat protein
MRCLMFTFTAHEGPVTSVAFAGPTGLLSTGVDGHVRLWNPMTGEKLLDYPSAEPALTPAASRLLGVVTNASGRFAAVGLQMVGVGFFDLDSGREVGWLRLSSLADFVPSPDGRSVFVLGVRGSAYLWQIGFVDAQEVARMKLGGRCDGRLAVAPDGSEVLVGGRKFLWPAGVLHKSNLTVSAPVNIPRVITHDKDKLFAPAGSRLGVWSYQIGVARQRLKGHIAPITALVQTPDGRHLWTASADATVKCWDVDTYRVEKTYRFPGGPLSCIAVSPDGNLGATGCGHKGTITVWDLS